MKLTTLTGLLLVVVPITFNFTFFLRQRTFEYPDILRKLIGHTQPRHAAGALRFALAEIVA